MQNYHVQQLTEVMVVVMLMVVGTGVTSALMPKKALQMTDSGKDWENKAKEIEDFVKRHVQEYSPRLAVQVKVIPGQAGHWVEWLPTYWHEAGIHPDEVRINIGQDWLGLPKSWYMLHLIPELVRWERIGIPYAVGVMPEEPQPWIDAVFLAARWGMLKEYEEVFFDEIVGEEEAVSDSDINAFNREIARYRRM